MYPRLCYILLMFFTIIMFARWLGQVHLKEWNDAKLVGGWRWSNTKALHTSCDTKLHQKTTTNQFVRRFKQDGGEGFGVHQQSLSPSSSRETPSFLFGDARKQLVFLYIIDATVAQNHFTNMFVHPATLTWRGRRDACAQRWAALFIRGGKGSQSCPQSEGERVTVFVPEKVIFNASK